MMVVNKQAARRQYIIVFVITLILLAVLAACTAGGDGNIYANQQFAQQTLIAGQGLLQSTRDAANQAAVQTQSAYAQSTLDAAATQGAGQMQLTMMAAQLEATQTVRALVLDSSNATATAVSANVTATVQAQVSATSAAATQAVVDRKAKDEETRARWNGYIIPLQAMAGALIGPLLFAIALALVITAFVAGYKIYKRFAPVVEARLRALPGKDVFLGRYTDEKGNPIDVIIDNSRTHSGVVEIRSNGIVPVNTAPSPAYQMHQNGLRATVDMAREFPKAQAERKEVIRIATDMMNAGQMPSNGMPGAIVPTALPLIAPWQSLTSYSGPALPMGIGEDGQILAPDPDSLPHRLVAGKTGAKKSRCGVRPAVTSALLHGWQVIALGDIEPIDLSLFEEFPNYHNLVNISQPAAVILYMYCVNWEIKRRWTLLKAAKVYRWSDMPAGAPPRILIVVDEFAGLVSSLENKERKTLFDITSRAAMLGRKGGVHLLLGAQNPTHEALRPSIKRNMLLQSFAVADQKASLAILNHNGAEALGDRQFLAVMGEQIVRGVAYEPQDEEIRGVLSRANLRALPAPEWVTNRKAALSIVKKELADQRTPEEILNGRDGDEEEAPEASQSYNQQPQDPGWVEGSFQVYPSQVTPIVTPVTGANGNGKVHEPIDPDAARREQVIEMYQAGKTKRQIEIALFQYDGGQAAKFVSQVIEDYEKAKGNQTSSTTSPTPKPTTTP